MPEILKTFLGSIDFAFMISFFPNAVLVSIRLSTLEPEYRDILSAPGASRLTIFGKIALPKTLPEFFWCPKGFGNTSLYWH